MPTSTAPGGAATADAGLAEQKRTQDLLDLAAEFEIPASRVREWNEKKLTRAEAAEIILKEERAKKVQVDTPRPEAEVRVHERSEDEFEKDPTKKGLRFARIALARAWAKAVGGTLDDARKWGERMWGDTPYVRVINSIRAISSNDQSAGGAFIPPGYSTDFIEFLRPMSVVRQLNPVIVQMDSGTMTVPRLAGGASAAYTGENNNANKTEQTTDDIVLVAKKLTALLPISNDWLRRAVPGSDVILRDDLAGAIAQRSDLAWIRGDGTVFGPKGLRFHAVPVTHVLAMTGSPDLAKVTSDQGRLSLALKGNNVRMLRPGWIMSPRTEECLLALRDGNGNFAFRDEMLALGRWRAYPYKVTTQVPENLGGGANESELYLADFADVVIGESTGLLIDTFPGGTYWDGSALQSGISRDQTVVSAITEHDVQMRHAFSVAVLTGVTWAPGAP
jgi:HK97 family phage major capsid protein